MATQTSMNNGEWIVVDARNPDSVLYVGPFASVAEAQENIPKGWMGTHANGCKIVPLIAHTVLRG